MKNGLEELGNYIETKIHLVNDFYKNFRLELSANSQQALYNYDSNKTLTPGSSLPSSHSKKAPPAVET